MQVNKRVKRPRLISRTAEEYIIDMITNESSSLFNRLCRKVTVEKNSALTEYFEVTTHAAVTNYMAH